MDVLTLENPVKVNTLIQAKLSTASLNIYKLYKVILSNEDVVVVLDNNGAGFGVSTENINKYFNI